MSLYAAGGYRRFGVAEKLNNSNHGKVEEDGGSKRLRLGFADRFNPLKYLYYQNFGGSSESGT